jgi:signal transduction histidine kinase
MSDQFTAVEFARPIEEPFGGTWVVRGSDRIRRWWSSHTLSTRFLLTGTLAICLTTLALGTWIDLRIRDSVVRNASAVSALYMESLISGPVQDLATRDKMTAPSKLAISDLIEDTALGHTVMEIKVWRTDGTVVFDSEHRLIGTKPPFTSELLAALSGRVTAELNDQDDVESLEQRHYGRPIFEVYAPMYEKGTQRIIGAAEIYEDGTNLLRELTIARQQSWLVAGSLMASMMAILFAVVYRSSQLLVRQKETLALRHQEKVDLLEANADLRARMAAAHQNTASILERQLRRVGADLHDGAAQLMALALLRLHEIATPSGEAPPSDAAASVAAIRGAIEKALSEIRMISAGLSLPELEELSPTDVILLAIDNHRTLTASEVTVKLDDLPESLPLPIRTCLFRCVHEGLSNAFRHAEGLGQTVVATSDQKWLILVLSDSGEGFDQTKIEDCAKRFGISGMRHRVEALGGHFRLCSRVGQGTQIEIVLPRTLYNA